jgi:predicted DNA-binding protein (UPF0251 family)
MPRKPRCRKVENEPQVRCFKPQGIPVTELKEVVLKVEELEAIRLKDFKNLEQEDCAQVMRVSRPTFQRILTSAHARIADALINGKALRIEGGDYCLGGGYCRKHNRILQEDELCDRITETTHDSPEK